MTTKYPSLSHLFLDVAPVYRGKSWRNYVATFRWEPEIVDYMRSLSTTRCQKRIDAYWLPGEVRPGRDSFRFGNVKLGSGDRGKRGDFCLLGGSIRNKHMHVHYRRVELIAGLGFDICIFNEVDKILGPINQITIMAAEATIFALTGGSGEKERLYNNLRKYHRGRV